MSTDTKTLQTFLYRYAGNHPAYQSFLNAHLIQSDEVERKTLYDRVLAEHGNRLLYYQYAWDLYLGKHWFSFSKKKPRAVTVNYIAININKNVSFLMNKGFLVESDFPEIEKLLQNTYKKNSFGIAERNSLGWEIGLTGCISGDAWLSTLFATDDGGASEYTKIGLLNSMYCFPVMSFDKVQGLLYYGREKFVREEAYGFSLYGTRMGGHYYKPGLRTRIIDEKARDTEEFIYPEIPITHIQNFPSTLSYYGFSDIRNISELNRLYDKLLTSVQDIVEYQGSPVTIIKGGKGTDLIRGANRVWSLTNKDAEISNLELQSDLGAISDHIIRINESLRESGNLPISASGKQQPISNTSASALAITFMPLYEVMELKRIMYGKGFLTLNKHIIKMNILAGKLDVNGIIKKRLERWRETYKGAGKNKRDETYPFRVKINEQINYNSLYAYYGGLIPEEIYETYLTWFPPLPRDEKINTDIAASNVTNKMWSIRHARSYIGMSEEESKLMDKEIAEDVEKYPELYGAQTIVTDKKFPPKKKTGLEGDPDVKGEKESQRRANE